MTGWTAKRRIRHLKPARKQVPSGRIFVLSPRGLARARPARKQAGLSICQRLTDHRPETLMIWPAGLSLPSAAVPNTAMYALPSSSNAMPVGLSRCGSSSPSLRSRPSSRDSASTERPLDASIRRSRSRTAYHCRSRLDRRHHSASLSACESVRPSGCRSCQAVAFN